MSATVHKLPSPQKATVSADQDLQGDWGADVSALLDGTYKVHLATVEGKAGIPQVFGTIRLEKNPALRPALARGQRSNPGVFWDLANTPQVQAALNKPIRAISGATMRLEERELPEWATDEDRAVAALHLDYCQRIWHEWTTETTQVADFARETLWTAGVCGFAWYEITAEVRTFDLVGIPRTVWVPKLHWRAPWTVSHWITQGEDLRGIVADFSQSYEYQGQSYKGQITLPAEKILHIAPEAVASNWEGRSWLRSCYNQILMLRQATRLQALGAEVGALGFLSITRDATTGANDDKNEATIKSLIGNRKAANVPGALWPAGYKAEMLKASDSIPDLTGWIDQLERHVLLALDAEDEVIALQSAGSYAARETASADARDAYDYLTSNYVAKPLEDVLRRMIRASFPEHGLAYVPRVQWSVVEERDNSVYLQDLYAFAERFPEMRNAAMEAAANLLDLRAEGMEATEE